MHYELCIAFGVILTKAEGRVEGSPSEPVPRRNFRGTIIDGLRWFQLLIIVHYSLFIMIMAW